MPLLTSSARLVTHFFDRTVESVIAQQSATAPSGNLVTSAPFQVAGDKVMINLVVLLVEFNAAPAANDLGVGVFNLESPAELIPFTTIISQDVVQGDGQRPRFVQIGGLVWAFNDQELSVTASAVASSVAVTARIRIWGARVP